MKNENEYKKDVGEHNIPIEVLSPRDLLLQDIREELGLKEDEEITEQLLSSSGRKLTPDEFATLMNWNQIPKFPKTPKFYNLRKMFRQLTSAEVVSMDKERIKAEKVNRGMQKIYSLLERAGV